ncbi:MAG: cation:proton antiporter [Spirochaetota bacterium]
MSIAGFFDRPFQDPVLVFGTVMVLILVAPALARKLRLPEIVGLILAGIIVGPFALGLLERDASIELLGKVGLLYIMFLAGLEIDLHQVKSNRSHTIIFGLITFAIPLAMGTALGYWVFGMTIPIAILLASMFSSHTLLTFPAVTKLGLAKTRSVTTAVGGTIITDTLALLVLAVVVSSSGGDLDAWFWVRLFGLMAVYLAATMILVPLIGRIFFRRMGTDENIEFVFVMALVFVISFLAHLAGLEPIIGAFLAGLTLNRLIPEKSLLMSRIHFTGDAIFIPFFLLSVGMLVDVRLLFAGASVWIVIAGMGVTAVVSKWIAARLSSVVLRYTRTEAGLLYGMSVNQAAATLAAVLIAFDIGLFDDTIITGTVMMIAVTCLVGSVVTQRKARALALEMEQAPYDASEAPHRIMVPVGAREGAKELLDVAILLRAASSEEPVYPVRVVHEGSDVDAELARAENALAHSVVRAMSIGMPVTPLTLVDINVGSGLVRAIRDNRISLTVCGWEPEASTRPHGFGRAIDQVIDQTRLMIVVNRLTQPVNSAERLVVVFPPFAERQTGFERVVATAKTLARQTGLSLLAVGTAQTLQSAGEFIETARPAVPVSFETVPVWKRVREHLESRVRHDDWLLLVTDRKGEIAWQPNLDRLPHELAAAFPLTNLSVIVPPTEPWDSVEAAEAHTDPSRTVARFAPERTLFALKSSTTEDAVAKLLSAHFGRRSPSAKAVSELLVTISREEPVELVEDVVLLHAHVPFVDDTVAFLGVSRRAFDIPVAGGRPHILIVLLDPVGQDPAKHLKALADIARLIRLPGLVPALREVKTYDEFRKEVSARQGGPDAGAGAPQG